MIAPEVTNEIYASQPPKALTPAKRRDFNTYSEPQQKSQGAAVSFTSSTSTNASDQVSPAWIEAYEAVDGNLHGREWKAVTLVSTTDNHSVLDAELGD